MITIKVITSVLLVMIVSFSSQAKSTLERVFHCEYKNQTVDFFMSNDLALYIHKKDGVTDFSYPNGVGGSLELFKLSALPTIGGADVKMSFKNGNYVYVIYDITRNNMGEYEFDSGFYVVSNGHEGIKKSCENEGATIKKKAYDLFKH